jgi:hypothetical protein
MSEKFTSEGPSDADINKALEQIWKSKEFRESILSAGMDASALRIKSVPFKAEVAEEQFGIGATILIGIASGVATHVAKNTLDALWALVKPRLLRRFGARLEPMTDEDKSATKPAAKKKMKRKTAGGRK